MRGNQRFDRTEFARRPRVEGRLRDERGPSRSVKGGSWLLVSDEKDRMMKYLAYFEKWKKEAKQLGDDKAFLAPQTYTNLRIGICGFFAFANSAEFA
jgi:hypothetical protein